MPPDQLTALARSRSPGRVGVRDELTRAWCWIELADLARAQGIQRAGGR